MGGGYKNYQDLPSVCFPFPLPMAPFSSGTMLHLSSRGLEMVLSAPPTPAGPCVICVLRGDLEQFEANINILHTRKTRVACLSFNSLFGIEPYFGPQHFCYIIVPLEGFAL